MLSRAKGGREGITPLARLGSTNRWAAPAIAPGGFLSRIDDAIDRRQCAGSACSRMARRARQSGPSAPVPGRPCYGTEEERQARSRRAGRLSERGRGFVKRLDAVPFALDTSVSLRGRSAYGILRQLWLSDRQPSTYRENAKACRAASSIRASSALSLRSRQTLMSLPTPPPILTKGSITTAPL
jgi:hypothetical protein